MWLKLHDRDEIMCNSQGVSDLLSLLAFWVKQILQLSLQLLDPRGAYIDEAVFFSKQGSEISSL